MDVFECSFARAKSLMSYNIYLYFFFLICHFKVSDLKSISHEQK